MSEIKDERWGVSWHECFFDVDTDAGTGTQSTLIDYEYGRAAQTTHTKRPNTLRLDSISGAFTSHP